MAHGVLKANRKSDALYRMVKFSVTLSDNNHPVSPVFNNLCLHVSGMAESRLIKFCCTHVGHMKY